MLLRNFMNYSKYVCHYFYKKLALKCLICGFKTTIQQTICAHCQHYLPIVPQHCRLCARFLIGSDALICGTCLTAKPAFDRTFVLFPYLPPIRNCILNLKFKHNLAFAKSLSAMMIPAIKKWYAYESLPHILLPVPLHKDRLKARGFNQAIELARPISKALNLKLDVNGVIRIKKTVAQSGLKEKERASNLQNAFFASHHYANQHIAILDDVITTGHTVRSLSKTLRENGAAKIDVWCLARRS